MQNRKILFYDFDDFRLDIGKEELSRNDEVLPLTHKAFQILLILVQNSGQTVEKETIYQALWGDSFVEDANLTQHIYILRKTLGSNASAGSYIETVARSGYRFEAQVTPIVAPAATQPFLPEKPRLMLLRNAVGKLTEVDDPHLSAAPQTPEAVNHGRRFFLAIATGVIVLAAIAIGVRTYIVTPAPGSAGGQARSIAVLPFKTIGDESINEKLGLGMADAVITRLGRLKTIPVRPTSAVFHYTDHPPDSSMSAGHEMGVDTILEGTVQRDNERIRVSVRLVSVSDGNTVWAENFDENSTDLFKVQDSISTKVVRALKLNLTPQQETALNRHATSSTEAYEAYQQGVYFGNFRTKDGLENAVTYFQKAIDADPNYARAYAMLSDSYNMLAYYHFADPYEMSKKASEAAAKALSIDEDIPETYIALAYLKLSGKEGLKESRSLLEKAIEISPYNSLAHVRYGWVLLNMKDLEGSVEQMRLAQLYDPASAISNGALCSVLAFQSKAEEAVKYCERSASITPNMDTAQLSLAEVYFAAGRHDDAISLAEKVISNEKGDERLFSLGSLGYFYAKHGAKSKALAIVDEIKPNASRRPMMLNDLVVINYALGKRDDGFAYFQQAFERRAIIPLRLNYDPMWSDVRADERIAQLSKQANEMTDAG